LPQEEFVKKPTIAAAAALLAGGCISTHHETLAVSCSEHIGRPISTRIAALGPPKAVYRINPTQVGYVFESRETVFVGGEPFYTVNYLVGSERHHTPIRPLTTACTGVFVVQAPTDAVPVSQRIIIDVVPAL
jgi:hypothetical protein